MTRVELLRRLDAMGDPTVGPYMHKIISDTGYPMRCIRMAPLRFLAKDAAKGDWRNLLSESRFETYEEVMVLGLAVACAQIPFKEKMEPLRELLPFLDSWALTDSIVSTLVLRAPDRQIAWEFAMECLESSLEYTVRFGVVMLMGYYLREDTVEKVAQRLVEIHDARYYVRMAVAWCFAEMAVNRSDLVLEILEEEKLDLFTHNMTIRKIRESYRISPEVKAAAAALRRKESKK